MWEEYIAPSAEKHGIDPELLKAFISVESGNDPNAVSSAGATGLMQIMPIALEDMGYDPSAIDLTNPEVSIDKGAEYMARLINHFKIPPNPRDLSAAYNMGPTAFKEKGGQAYEETRKHQDKIAAEMGEAEPELPAPTRAVPAPELPEPEIPAGIQNPTIFREGKDELSEIREETDPILLAQAPLAASGAAKMVGGFSAMSKITSPEFWGKTVLSLGLSPIFKHFEKDGKLSPMSEMIRAELEDKRETSDILTHWAENADQYWLKKAEQIWEGSGEPLDWATNPMNTYGKAIEDTWGEDIPWMKTLADMFSGEVTKGDMLSFMYSMGDVALSGAQWAKVLRFNADNVAATGGQLARQLDDFSLDMSNIRKGIKGRQKAAGKAALAEVDTGIGSLKKGEGAKPKALTKKKVEVKQFSNEELGIAVDDIIPSYSKEQAEQLTAALDGAFNETLRVAGKNAEVDELVDLADSFEANVFGRLRKNLWDQFNVVANDPNIPDFQRGELLRPIVSRMKAINVPVRDSNRGLQLRMITEGAGGFESKAKALEFAVKYDRHGKEFAAAKPNQFKFQTEARFRDKSKAPLKNRVMQHTDSIRANMEAGSNRLARDAGKGDVLGPITMKNYTNAGMAAMANSPISGRKGMFIYSRTKAPFVSGTTMGDLGNFETVMPSVTETTRKLGLNPKALKMTAEEFDEFKMLAGNHAIGNRRVVDSVKKVHGHDRLVKTKDRLQRAIAGYTEEHDEMINAATRNKVGLSAKQMDELRDMEALIAKAEQGVKRIDGALPKYEHTLSNQEVLLAQSAVNASQDFYKGNEAASRGLIALSDYITDAHHGSLRLLTESGRLSPKQAKILVSDNEMYTAVKRVVDDTIEADAVGRAGGKEIDDILLPWKNGNKALEEDPIGSLLTRLPAIQRFYLEQDMYKSFWNTFRKLEPSDQAKYFPGWELQLVKKQPVGKHFAPYWLNGKKFFLTGNDVAMEEVLMEGFGKIDRQLQKRATTKFPLGFSAQQATSVFRKAVTISLRWAARNAIRDPQSAYLLSHYPHEMVWTQMKGAGYMIGSSVHRQAEGRVFQRYFEKMAGRWDEFLHEGYSMGDITSIHAAAEMSPTVKGFDKGARSLSKEAGKVFTAPAKFTENLTRGGQAVRIFAKRDDINKKLGLLPGVWYPKQFVGQLSKEAGVKVKGMYGASEAFDKAIRPGKYPVEVDGKKLGFFARQEYWEGAGGYPTKANALFDVRDATVDFNRYGRWMHHLNKIFPFFNAGVRETVRAAKIVSDQPISTIYRSAKSSGIMTMYEHAKFRGDPDWEGQPAWRKKAMWSVGRSEDGNLIMLPVGFLVNMVSKLMWSTLYDTMYELRDAGDTDVQGVIDAYDKAALEEFGEGWEAEEEAEEYREDEPSKDRKWVARRQKFSLGVAETLSEQQPVPGVGPALRNVAGWAELPSGYRTAGEGVKDFFLSISPQNVKPLGELAFNWDEWKDRPVNYESTMPNRGDSKLTMFDEYTSPAMINWAEFADKYSGSGKYLGPRDWEQMIEGYFGNVGIDAVNLGEEMIRETTMNRAREGKGTSVRHVRPAHSNTPYGILANFMNDVGRRGFTVPPATGTRSPWYDLFFDIQSEIDTHTNTIGDFLGKDMFPEAVEEIRANPGYIRQEMLGKIIDRVESNPYTAKRVKKKLKRDQRNYDKAREYALPSSIVSDVNDRKRVTDKKIKANIQQYAVNMDEVMRGDPNTSVDERTKVWLKHLEIEKGYQRDLSTLFRDAVDRYYKLEEKELPMIQAYLSQISDEDMISILMEKDTRDLFLEEYGPNRTLGRKRWEYEMKKQELQQ